MQNRDRQHNGESDENDGAAENRPAARARGGISGDGLVTLPTKERDGRAALEISSSRDCLAPCAHRRGAESAMR